MRGSTGVSKERTQGTGRGVRVLVSELIDLRGARRRSRVGGKAANLRWLARQGCAVPPTWVVPVHTVAAATTNPASLAASLARTLDPTRTYAVRSSAVVEDSDEHSFAGRFLTRLGVPASEVVGAVLEVAAQARAGTAAEYAAKLGAPSADELPVAVIVQQMVDPVSAGVVFSRNPVSGVKETVIEAAAGLGEDLVSGRARAERWVRRRGEWLLSPESTPLPLEAASQIADGAERLEQALGRPVDAEWAWDGEVWWLQVRPITVGADAAVYSSRMARDMLPGLIKPLVWSINGPVMGDAHVRFLEEVFGPLNVTSADLATLFHYRVYINIGALSRLAAEFGFPEDSLEVLAGMQPGASMPRMPHPTHRVLKRAPRMATTAVRLTRFDRTLARRLPALWQRSRAFKSSTQLEGVSASGLLDRAEHLQHLVAEMAYHHLVTLMLMQMYGIRARGRLKRDGLDPDIAVARIGAAVPAEASRHNLGRALDRLTAVAAEQPEAVRALISAGDLESLRVEPQAAEFCDAFDAFVADFGHFSDSGVNFSVPSWAEEPDKILGMVAARLAAAASGGSTTDGKLRSQPVTSRRTRRACERAAAFHALRDETSSLCTHAYGQFRPIMLAVGRELEREQALESAEDVFYLTTHELRRAAEGHLKPSHCRAMVRQRRDEMEAAGRGEPPEVVVGATAELVQMPGRTTLRGISASRGRYTGKVVVCRGLRDLDRVENGDVVVVPYSDASWSPLFTRAGAIVAESGGMLSHSAILARELGLPALVAVRGALGLPDGALVSIDCYDSTVTILGEAS